jgi:GTP cyclohydrolase II
MPSQTEKTATQLIKELEKECDLSNLESFQANCDNKINTLLESGVDQWIVKYEKDIIDEKIHILREAHMHFYWRQKSETREKKQQEEGMEVVTNSEEQPRGMSEELQRDFPWKQEKGVEVVTDSEEKIPKLIKKLQLLEELHEKVLQPLQERLQELKNRNLSPAERQCRVDSLRESYKIKKTIMYDNQIEHIELMSNLNDTLNELTGTVLSPEQCENLRKTAQDLQKSLEGLFNDCREVGEKILELDKPQDQEKKYEEVKFLEGFYNIHKNMYKRLTELKPVVLLLAQRETTRQDDHSTRLSNVEIIRSLSDALIKSQKMLLSWPSDWQGLFLEIHSSSCEKFDKMLVKHKEILGYMLDNQDLSQIERETLVSIKKASQQLLSEIVRYNANIPNITLNLISGGTLTDVEYLNRHEKWEKKLQGNEEYLEFLEGYLEIPNKLRQADGETPQHVGQMLEENFKSLADNLAKDLGKIGDRKYQRKGENDNRMELIEALKDLHSDLMTHPDLSQAESTRLRLQMLEKWHKELKDLSSQDYYAKLQSIQKLGKDYKHWRETGITPPFFTESSRSSFSQFISSIWQTARDWWESGETPTSSNPERSEAIRRFSRSQPSRWRDF